MISLMWLVLGAILCGVSIRTSAFPLAPWLGLAFILHALRGLPPLRGLICTAIALYVALALGNRGIIPIGGPIYFLVIAAITIIGIVPFAADRLLATRNPAWISTLIFPAAWVAIEFAKSRLVPGASWGSIAYSQYGNLPLMQLVSVTGIWGISFLITWFASIASWAWDKNFIWTTIRVPIWTFAGLIAVVLIAGGMRLAIAHSDGRSIRAAAVSFPTEMFMPGERTRIAEGRLDAADRDGMEVKLSQLHDWFLERTRIEARSGAQLVAWPETNLLVFKEDEPTFIERARQVAAEEKIYLAMGMGTVQTGAPKPFENKVVLVDPSGKVVFSYLKSRPVAGWEEGIMVPGDGHLPVVSTNIGRLGSAICYDADYPEYVREFGRARADLWILPANDWEAIKNLHFEMAVFRAIENGVPIFRPASLGLSGAFDAWGRVMGATDHFSGARSLVVQIPVGNIPTLYPNIGDLFAWLCVAGFVAGSIAMIRM